MYLATGRSRRERRASLKPEVAEVPPAGPVPWQIPARAPGLIEASSQSFPSEVGAAPGGSAGPHLAAYPPFLPGAQTGSIPGASGAPSSSVYTRQIAPSNEARLRSGGSVLRLTKTDQRRACSCFNLARLLKIGREQLRLPKPIGAVHVHASIRPACLTRGRE